MSKETTNTCKIMRRLDFLANNLPLTLTIICIISLFFKLYYFPHGVPLTHDAVLYFWYAIDTNELGHFPTGYEFPNTGWSMLLSLFFGIFHSNNFIDYMAIQRLGTIIISVLTIIPVYFLCRKFFSNSISLVGASLFAFEPHLIQNSILGLTDTLYGFLIIVSFVLMQSSNKKLVYLSFPIAALSSLVRYEGMLFLIVLTIIFFVRFRKEGKVVLKYLLALSIYILALLPIQYVRIQTTGDDGVVSSVIAGAIVTERISSGQSDISPNLVLFLSNGIINLIKYTGWIMIPYFVILVPIGVILGFKRKSPHYFGMILSIIVLAIPALYAYAREIQETRYLLVLMPFFTVLSLFVIDSIANKTSRRKLFFILLIVCIFSLSWIFLEFKKIDQEHEREAFAIAQQVAKFTKVTNVYEPESKYLKIATIGDNFPTLRSSSPPPTITLSADYTSITDFIKSNKDAGLTHIVVDDNKNRPNFLKDLFSHDKNYPYLNKVFDSSDNGFKYHVKIYKINYEEFLK
jgi:hypothetical protein